MICRPSIGALVLIFTALIAGFAGCNASVGDLCSTRLPELNLKLENAFTVLTTVDPNHVPESPTRKLAGLKTGFLMIPRSPLADIELSLTDRRSWQEWAQVRLKETQSCLDLMAAHPQLRPAHQDLTDVANYWVAFEGYAYLSQVDRMVTVLGRIRESSARASGRVCAPPENTPNR